MIVDDQILRVGSANMNNRSLGLDTECDVFIDADRPANASAAAGIQRIRHSLLAEHLGLEEGEMAGRLADAGSMAALIESLGPDRKRSLRRYQPPANSSVHQALARSQFMDPERAEDTFEPFARDGMFPKGRGLRRKGE